MYVHKYISYNSIHACIRQYGNLNKPFFTFTYALDHNKENEYKLYVQRPNSWALLGQKFSSLTLYSYVAILRTSYSIFLFRCGWQGWVTHWPAAGSVQKCRAKWVQKRTVDSDSERKNSRWITHPGQFCLPSSGFHQVRNQTESLVYVDGKSFWIIW